MHWANRVSGFVSGRSNHGDRLQTIRFAVYETYGVMLDTHTADGLKAVLENWIPASPWSSWRDRPAGQVRGNHPRGPGREPSVRTTLFGIENLPQRVVVMEPDVAAIKRYIAERV